MKTWITIFGLVLQLFSVLPGYRLVWRPDPIEFTGDFGTIIKIEEKLSRRERRLLCLGLTSLLVGTVFQIIGTCL